MPKALDVWDNPILREQHWRQRAAIRKRIPQLAACQHGHYLSLGKYLSDCPERFFSVRVFEEYTRFLDDRHRTSAHDLRDYLEANEHRLDGALFSLDEVNRHTWHDVSEHDDDYELLRFIDQEVHPAYLRVLEGAFGPMIHLVAFFSRRERGKSTDGLGLFPAVEELEYTALSHLRPLYHQVVRNGIAHGGVKYLDKAIRYEDDRGNQEVASAAEVVRLFEDLVDACNAMALAHKAFAFAHQLDGYAIPRYLMIEELQAATDSPWWHIEGCVPCERPGGTQLLLYARPRTRDFAKVYFHCFLSAVLAEHFAPGYDRYFLALRSPYALPGFAAFNGHRMKEVREKSPESLTDYQGILEDDLLFYAPRHKLPRFLSKLDSLIQSIRVHAPLMRDDLRASLGAPRLTPRVASVHRSGVWSVLKGAVVIEPVEGLVDKRQVRESCRRVIRQVASEARKTCRLLDVARYLPLGYARVAVFRRDYRKRRLSSFGLGPDLICTVQISRLSRIRAPDIAGSEIERRGRYRIAWNRSWLAANGTCPRKLQGTDADGSQTQNAAYPPSTGPG